MSYLFIRDFLVVGKVAILVLVISIMRINALHYSEVVYRLHLALGKSQLSDWLQVYNAKN